MRFGVLAVVLVLMSLTADAQSTLGLPARGRLTPEGVADAALYMTRSIRADRVLWSPGGSLLAVVDDVDVLLFSVSDWTAEPVRLRSARPVVDLAFSRSGALLYIVETGSITAWNVETGTSDERYISDARRIAVSPDDRQLAVLTRHSTVDLVNLSDRSTVSINAAPPVDGLSYTSSGQQIVISNGRGGGAILDPVLRQAVVDIPNLIADAAGLTVPRAVAAPGGRRSAILQVATGPTALVRHSVGDGALEAEYVLPAAFARVYGWDVNSRAGLVVGAGIGRSPEQSAVVAWHYSDAFAIATLAHPGIRDAAISPDGTLIASVGGGALRLWSTSDSVFDAEFLAGISRVNVVAACSTLGVRPSVSPPIAGQTISAVWSWYAASPRLVEDYLDTATYTLTLDGIVIRPWIFVSRIAPDEANSGDPTVYLYAPLGPVRAGSHWTTIDVTWAQPIDDGYAEFGPGTANPSDGGECQFTAQ